MGGFSGCGTDDDIGDVISVTVRGLCNPDIFETAPEHLSLLIAGHTHGGQVYLPLLGRPMVPSKYGNVS